MKYNQKDFNNAVEYYTKALKGRANGKLVCVVMRIGQDDAFYSLAPLSRAIHNLGGDVYVAVIDENSVNLDVMKDVWAVHEDLKKGIDNEKTKALKDFIEAVDKAAKTKEFGEIFKGPDITLNAEDDKFRGTLELGYKSSWHKKYRWDELLETTARIWKQGYALRKGEITGISFVLVPSEKETELPLEDYLDSFSIAMAFSISAKKFGVRLRLGSCSDRKSMLAKPVRIAELIGTLRGCELSKEVDEDVFKKYKVLSNVMSLGRIDFNRASFGIHGKGYYGKHFFGDKIGYPSLDKRTRWSSPGQLMLKDRYEPQTIFEKRDPMMRYAITETLPLDIFIDTCNVDYFKLRRRSEKIRNIFNKCEFIRVVGSEKGKHKTDFTVYLVSKQGKRRLFTAHDCDVRSLIDKEYYDETKIKAGTYANFPSGETFVTPDSIQGIMVGDVVINIDRSRVIPPNNPLIMKFKGNSYQVIDGPKEIIETMIRERNDAKHRLKDLEKNNSLPKEVVEIYRNNFMNIGEFAVNTNPKAKLCDYLIVNEKIAGMIHVALGSGFERDRKSLYHWDIVVNALKQKLDIYGVDKKNKQRWVLKKGKFVA